VGGVGVWRADEGELFNFDTNQMTNAIPAMMRNNSTNKV